MPKKKEPAEPDVKILSAVCTLTHWSRSGSQDLLKTKMRYAKGARVRTVFRDFLIYAAKKHPIVAFEPKKGERWLLDIHVGDTTGPMNQIIEEKINPIIAPPSEAPTDLSTDE